MEGETLKINSLAAVLIYSQLRLDVILADGRGGDPT
jgi:hypothetical protein